MSFKDYISKSTLIILIISALIVLGTSGCKNATDNSGSVSDSQFNAPGADSASAPNQAEAENFVYDDKWRDKITDTDTELCLKDIISSGFDFQTIYKTPDKEKDGLASKYLDDLMTIDTKETELKNLQNILTMDILISERELYKLSKGKYRCNIINISEYEIKEFSGFDKRFMQVFKNFILIYQKDAFKRFSADDTNYILNQAYYFMIAKAYQKFIKDSGYDMTFSFPIIDKPANGDSLEAPDANAATPAEKLMFNQQDNDDRGVKDGKIDLDRWMLNPDALGESSDKYNAISKLLVISTINEVKKEQGKKTSQFFSIKQCLKPCLKSPATCYDDMAYYYHESIYKLIRATTVLAFTLDTIPVEQIGYFSLGFASQIFSLAAQNQLSNINDPNTIQILSASPVGKEILESSLDDKSKSRIIGIWFLRQVHYAVETIYNATDYAQVTQYNEFVKKIEEGPVLWKVLDKITYDSKPANIDWKKYIQKKH